MLSERLRSIKRKKKQLGSRKETIENIHMSSTKPKSSGCSSCESEKNYFTVYILQQNTVVGTNADWISLTGIYVVCVFKFNRNEMKPVAFVKQLVS